jgi:2-desacetyl-2-hydroxyethyl bacteriochlorophyllide A dehydrogenase
MPAAVYRAKGELDVEERPVPDPGPGEVLVEVSHCGVCGSDLHMVLDGWGQPGRVGGHEWSGRVAALGPGVDGWALGAPVVGGELVTCGACVYCAAGRPSLCKARDPIAGDGYEGAFARYVLTSAAGLLPVDDSLGLRTAALTEPLAVALHALTRSGVGPGERVLVTGAGPIGLLAVAALRAAGIDDIVVSEPAATRRERAAAVGAADVVTPDDLDAPAMPMDLVAHPFDVVLECSGRADAMEAGLAQLERTGRLVLVGAGIRRPKLDNNRILLNELLVTGAFNYDRGGFASALALLASDALPVDLLVEPDDVPLSGLLDAMHKLASAELAAKVLVAPKEGTPA